MDTSVRSCRLVGGRNRRDNVGTCEDFPTHDLADGHGPSAAAERLRAVSAPAGMRVEDPSRRQHVPVPPLRISVDGGSHSEDVGGSGRGAHGGGSDHVATVIGPESTGTQQAGASTRVVPLRAVILSPAGLARDVILRHSDGYTTHVVTTAVSDAGHGHGQGMVGHSQASRDSARSTGSPNPAHGGSPAIPVSLLPGSPADSTGRPRSSSAPSTPGGHETPRTSAPTTTAIRTPPFRPRRHSPGHRFNTVVTSTSVPGTPLSPIAESSVSSSAAGRHSNSSGSSGGRRAIPRAVSVRGRLSAIAGVLPMPHYGLSLARSQRSSMSSHGRSDTMDRAPEDQLRPSVTLQLEVSHVEGEDVSGGSSSTDVTLPGFQVSPTASGELYERCPTTIVQPELGPSVSDGLTTVGHHMAGSGGMTEVCITAASSDQSRVPTQQAAALSALSPPAAAGHTGQGKYTARRDGLTAEQSTSPNPRSEACAEHGVMDCPACLATDTAIAVLMRDTTVTADKPTAQPRPAVPREMACVDYTPCTEIRPVDFTGVLRPVQSGRRIRLCIAVTVYNEDGDELQRTLKGVAENLRALHAAGLHWSEIAVIVVLDGRAAASESMLRYAESGLQCYSPSALVTEQDGCPVTMHVFQRTVRMVKNGSQRTYHEPMQLVFALKEKNAGKLNSHLWFFTAFCNQLNPKYCLLLDVGTVPRPRALARMYRALEEAPQVGGACGEITVRNASVLSPLEASQSFEYCVSHILDKAMESCLGFVPVLPGAFSAYRWMAIRGEPLAAYFSLEETNAKDLSPFVANMFLAEDRILCFEIVAQADTAWTLAYIPGCAAETDVPTTLTDLMKQRRRWLNGSLFASLRYLWQFSRVLRTRHSPLRKLLFIVQWMFTAVNTVLAWLSVSTLFLSLLLVFGHVFRASSPGTESIMTSVFVLGYLATLFTQVVLGLTGVNPSRVSGIYLIIAVLYGLMMVAAVAIGLWLVALASLEPLVLLSSIFTLGAYVVAGLLHGKTARVLLSIFQYIMLIPFFVTVLSTYSICNIQDCSWGTRPGSISSLLQQEHQRNAQDATRLAQQMTRKQDNGTVTGGPNSHNNTNGLPPALALDAEAAKQRALAEQYAKDKAEQAIEFNLFRGQMVLSWFLSNALVVLAVAYFDVSLRWFALVVAGSLMFQTASKLAGSFYFQAARAGKGLSRALCCCCYRLERIPGRPRGYVRARHCCGRGRAGCGSGCGREPFEQDDAWEAEGTEHMYPQWETGHARRGKRGTGALDGGLKPEAGGVPVSLPLPGRDRALDPGLGRPCCACLEPVELDED